ACESCTRRTAGLFAPLVHVATFRVSIAGIAGTWAGRRGSHRYDARRVGRVVGAGVGAGRLHQRMEPAETAVRVRSTGIADFRWSGLVGVAGCAPTTAASRPYGH